MSGIAGKFNKADSKIEFASDSKTYTGTALQMQLLGRLARTPGAVSKNAQNKDDQIIAEAFAENGSTALNTFTGDFALALWSDEDEALYLYRSSANAPEIFIYEGDDEIHFASEATKLFTVAKIKPEVNEAKLYKYLRFGEGDTNESFFAGLNKVLPGQIVAIAESYGLSIPKQNRKTGQFTLTKASARKWLMQEAATPQALELKLRTLMKKAQEPQTLAAGSYDPQTFLSADFKTKNSAQEDSGAHASPGLQNSLKDWLLESKIGVYYLLMSPNFEERGYFNQVKAAVGFSDFLREKDVQKADAFWRLTNAEIWLREFFDEKEVANVSAAGIQPKEKSDLEPNAGKTLEIQANGAEYLRYPLRTKSFSRGDSLEDYVSERVGEFIENHGDETGQWWKNPWYVYVAEKIVAITQTRSHYVWEIEPGWWARKLSSKITPSSYGYGLSIPWTMELAIREVGLPRILLASAGSVLGKLVGKAGVFYMIAGPGVRAIDGPLESPVYPSYLSAKLAPSNTDQAAAQISAKIRQALPAEALKNYQGTVIIDANDVGRHVLGKDIVEANENLEAVFDDNPLGQGGERTPMAVVYRNESK